MIFISDAEKIIFNGLHPSLQKIVAKARETGVKFRLTCGQRGKVAQNAAKASGNSNATFGQSPHNYAPALAFDFVPLDSAGNFKQEYWNKLEMFAAVANAFSKLEKICDVNIVWGADWNDNGSTADDKFKDYPHIQLSNWKIIKGILAK